MVFVPEIVPRWDEEAVYRRNHIEPGTSVYEYNSDIFPDILDEVLERLRMHACWTITENGIETGVSQLDHADGLLVCLFAIEQVVMDRMDEHLAERDLPEAFLLDALVNEIMFNAADDLCSAACRQVEAEGRQVSQRYLPGEDGVPLSVQGELIQLFDGVPEASAVSIKENGVLWPEKSAIYLFGVSKN